MAKGTKNSNRSRRGASRTANRRLPTSPTKAMSSQMDLEDLIRMTDMRSVEDRRTYHPDREFRSPLDVRGVPRHTLAVPAPQPRSNYSGLPAHVAFQAPHDVLVCVRRNTRKEVLHAFKKTGKSGQKRPRRTPFSNIQC